MVERNEIFDFIRDEISAGVCISGDSHMGELNCIPWSERGGYDFYDFLLLAARTGAGGEAYAPGAGGARARCVDAQRQYRADAF